MLSRIKLIGGECFSAVGIISNLFKGVSVFEMKRTNVKQTKSYVYSKGIDNNNNNN